MSVKKEITLRIADMEPLSLSVSSEEVERWYNARDLVNRLWKLWRTSFPEKSSKEVLAMVAVSYAQAFVVHSASEQETKNLLDEFEKNLDSLLVDDIVKNQE